MFKMDSVQMSQQLSHVAHDRDKIYQWIVELCNPETRENALSELRYIMTLELKFNHVY